MMDYSFKGRKKGKTFVILLRHGDKDHSDKIGGYSLPGPALTTKGKKQSRKVAQKLSEIKEIDTIFSSPMLRAKQTAEIISDKINKDFELLNDFYEFRDLSGKNKPSLILWVKEFLRYKRVVREFNRIMKKNKGKILVFCLHVRVIQYLIGNKLDISFSDSQKIVINNCHFNLLRFFGKNLESVYLLNSKYLEQNV